MRSLMGPDGAEDEPIWRLLAEALFAASIELPLEEATLLPPIMLRPAEGPLLLLPLLPLLLDAALP